VQGELVAVGLATENQPPRIRRPFAMPPMT
jgi:hypothetical protein